MGPPQGYWSGAWHRGLSPVQQPLWCWGTVPSLVSKWSRSLSDCAELAKARTKAGLSAQDTKGMLLLLTGFVAPTAIKKSLHKAPNELVVIPAMDTRGQPWDHTPVRSCPWKGNHSNGVLFLADPFQQKVAQKDGGWGGGSEGLSGCTAELLLQVLLTLAWSKCLRPQPRPEARAARPTAPQVSRASAGVSWARAAERPP